MSRRWLVAGAALALGLAAIVSACEKSPAMPTPPPQGRSGPPTASRLEITGPRAIVPGVPTQFTATVHMSDRSSRDVTTSATWRSPWDAFVISAPGLVTARWNGSVAISAAYEGLTSTREVIAVPEGTFRLTGTVTDVTAPAGPVSYALVEVKDGIGRGLSTRTGLTGFYDLHGVAGDIELRVTKEGYRTLDHRVVVTDHQTLNLDLPIAGQLPDLRGSWVLTITAADTCSTALPAEAMSRKYSAVITQVGTNIKIDLSGARFATLDGWPANVIDDATSGAEVLPDRVRFYLGQVGCVGYMSGGGCSGYSVMEELAPSRFYLPSGHVTLAISPTALSGELDGEISIHTRSAQDGPLYADQYPRETSCRSSRHRVTFSK